MPSDRIALDPHMASRPPMERLAARLAETEGRVRNLQTGKPFAFDTQPSTVTITGPTQGTWFDLGGPYLQVEVPSPGSFVELYVTAELRHTNAGTTGTEVATVGVKRDASGGGGSAFAVLQYNTNTFRAMATAPGVGIDHGGNWTEIGVPATTIIHAGGFWTWYETAGIHTYNVVYATAAPLTAGSAGAEFRNRTAWSRLA